MDLNLIFLDYIWKSLPALFATSTVLFGSTFALEHIFIKKSSGKDKKWFFNFQSAFLIFTLILSFLLIKANPEILSACFTKFAETSNSITITRFISGFYLLVLSTLLILDLSGIVVAFVQMKSLVSNKNENLRISIIKIANQLGLNKSIHCFISDKHTSPFVWGLKSSRLVVPKFILNSEQENLEAIISHELIHIRDRDSIWLLTSHLCKRILFFHPMVYILSNKHHLSVELAADELAVLNCGVRSKKLVESLIELASVKNIKTSLLQVNASRGYQHLKDRILAISTFDKHCKLDWKFSCSASLALIFSIGFAISQAQASGIKIHQSLLNSDVMCSQIQHEKIFETWLKIKPNLSRCEK